MKKYAVLLMIIFTGCMNRNSTLTSLNTNTDTANHNQTLQNSPPSLMSFTQKDLIGIWALSNDTNENASVRFTLDSVEYLDSEYSPNHYRLIEGDIEIYIENVTTYQNIFFSSRDSFFTILDGDTVRYYRRVK